MTIKEVITIGMFGFVLTGTSAVADAAENIQLQTRDQIQLQNQDRVGPEVPKSTSNQYQKQNKNTYEYRYEKQQQISNGQGDRSVNRPMNRSFDSGVKNGGSMGMNHSGGAGKR
ncbi:hypothetical protein QCB45_01885 [Thiomicrorhabdus sp. ZW0627]|uniref:hypothetical protein n=1 Tax=Thiomicrorhabdus sp. ZW0627 TaxID=3039774 RepID=UPI0024369CC2|nr:hypothetical protein [Thiomicrorhabdus sp. ZW0627]MDG6773067.1 hypothetical protein [Thiomicrorhabdus sp. ZW0627]